MELKEMNPKKVEEKAEEEEEEVEVKCKTGKILLELGSIVIVFTLVIIELSNAVSLYGDYTRILNCYYYETILFSIKNIDFIKELTMSPNSTCGQNYQKYKFQQLTDIKGICLIPSKEIPDLYDFYFNTEELEPQITIECKKSELIFYTVGTIYFWNKFYYCSKSESHKNMKLYLIEGNSCSSIKNSMYCGSYYDYSVCVRQQTGNLNECPFLNIKMNTSLEEIRNRGLLANEIYIGQQHVVLIRNVTNDIHGIYFSIRLGYGKASMEYDNTTLRRPYISYYKNNFFDFNDSRLHTVMTHPIETENQNGFKQDFIDFIKNTSNVAAVLNYPDNPFVIRYKQALLPKKECLKFFNFTSLDNDFFNQHELFIHYCDLTMSRTVGWTIIELIFFCMFLLYYNAYLLVKELRGMKINHYDREGSTLSELTKILFVTWIVGIKYWNALIQGMGLSENISFAKNMIDYSCYADDPFLHNSIKLLYDDLTEIYSNTKILVYIITARYSFLVLIFICKVAYAPSKKYAQVEEVVHEPEEENFKKKND